MGNIRKNLSVVPPAKSQLSMQAVSYIDGFLIKYVKPKS